MFYFDNKDENNLRNWAHATKGEYFLLPHSMSQAEVNQKAAEIGKMGSALLGVTLKDFTGKTIESFDARSKFEDK